MDDGSDMTANTSPGEELEPDVLEMLLSSVRKFVDQRIIPSEAEVDETDEIPPRLVQEMRDLGLFGLTIPRAYGGLGLDMTAEVQVAFELGRAAPAFRSTIGTNNGIGSLALVLAGTDEQRQRYLPRMAAGELIGSFALTEPDAGSDAKSLRTAAVRDGRHYVLNGQKRFITNAPVAGVFTVMARTGGPGADGISTFLVEAGTPGLRLGKPDVKMGQHGSKTCDVYFDDCRVPVSALIGAEGEGFKIAMKVLDRGRPAHRSGLRRRRRAPDRRGVAYASQRIQFGRKIADFQLIQAMLADSQTEAYAGRAMVLDAAGRRDARENIAMVASCCKYFCSEMVGRIADRAVQIHGGYGYMAEYAVERLYRDVRLFRLYEGTSQIQQLIIARAMLTASA